MNNPLILRGSCYIYIEVVVIYIEVVVIYRGGLITGGCYRGGLITGGCYIQRWLLFK